MSGAAEITSFPSPSLAEKVAFLGRPQSYPHAPPSVEVKETHMSWVFLAGSLVYKLKKPVSYPFLDFTTLEARRTNCLEEVRLSARLAEGVYLGTIPLYMAGAGNLSLQPPGEVVEWLVHMRRLPSGRMLDELIASGSVGAAEIGRAAGKLVRFYLTSAQQDVRADWVLARFRAEHEEDARLLSDSRFDLASARTGAVLLAMDAALARVGPYLDARARAGVYVDGHGDLRPEHVCLLPEPVFIDCLEFNRDLRILDPFDEIAYLALECERLGAPWVGEAFLATAQKELSPPAPEALICFYRAARALLRARLAVAHLTEPSPRTPAKWEPRARHYVSLAEASLRRFDALLGPG